MSKLSQLAEDLVQAREGKQQSIEQLSQKTRIRTELLKNFESGNFHALPLPYIIPMMKVYAKELGLPESVVDECKHELGIDDIPDNTKHEVTTAGSSTGLGKENLSERDFKEQHQSQSEPLWLASAFHYRYAIIASIVLFISLLGFSYWWFFSREKAVIIRQTARNNELVQEQSKTEQPSNLKPEIPKEWLSGKDTIFASSAPVSNSQTIATEAKTQEVTLPPLTPNAPKDTVKLKKAPKAEVGSAVSDPIVIDQLSNIPKRSTGESEELRLLSQEQGISSEQNAVSEKKTQSKKYRLVFQLNPESEDTCKVSVVIEGKGTRSVSLYSTNRTARFDADTTMSINVEKVEVISVMLNESKVSLPKTTGELTNFRVTEP